MGERVRPVRSVQHTILLPSVYTIKHLSALYTTKYTGIFYIIDFQ